MNTKEYLLKYRDALQKVRQYEERIEMVSETLKGTETDGQPRGTSIGKPTETTAINLTLLKEQLTFAMLEAEEIRQEIASEIDKMPNPKYREILYLRYVKLEPWNKITKRLDDLRPGKEYELKSVIGYMHRRALKEFEEVHDERE